MSEAIPNNDAVIHIGLERCGSMSIQNLLCAGLNRGSQFHVGVQCHYMQVPLLTADTAATLN